MRPALLLLVPILAAAALHDTVEDTQTSLDDIEREFGTAVASMVAELTDDKSLPKAERKRLQVIHAPHVSPAAALVKIADKIVNVRDIARHPPTGWDSARRLAYLDWAEQVVAHCPRVNPSLDACFAKTLAMARRQFAQPQASTPDQ